MLPVRAASSPPDREDLLRYCYFRVTGRTGGTTKTDGGRQQAKLPEYVPPRGPGLATRILLRKTVSLQEFLDSQRHLAA